MGVFAPKTAKQILLRHNQTMSPVERVYAYDRDLQVASVAFRCDDGTSTGRLRLETVPVKELEALVMPERRFSDVDAELISRAGELVGDEG